MAEDLDLDRVINDPAYRRRVIARLNGADDERLPERDAIGERPLSRPADQQSLD